MTSLPKWTKPKHVKREVFGRFLVDAGILHDVQRAKPACDLDNIRNATFYHFASELPEGLSPCPECMPE